MSFTHRAPVNAPLARTNTATRTWRKVAMCGSHSASLVDAPWSDPSWEWWGHASSRAWYQRPMDRYFDLHPKACWTRGGKKTAAYPRWLAKNTVPIYMQDRFEEVPASVKYPKGQILLQFGNGRPYFTNHLSWMIALALSEGVQEIGLFGINYGVQSEYATQRGSAEYWLGRAAGAGVKVLLTDQCSLLRDPKLLYGFESHDEETGLLKPEYQAKQWKAVETIKPVTKDSAGLRVPPKEIAALIKAEEREYPRPDWALRPLPVSTRTDGSNEGEGDVNG